MTPYDVPTPEAFDIDIHIYQVMDLEQKYYREQHLLILNVVLQFSNQLYAWIILKKPVYQQLFAFADLLMSDIDLLNYKYVGILMMMILTG